MGLKTAIMGGMMALLAGCASADMGEVFTSKSPSNDMAMRWDHLPKGEEWTEATMDALDSHGTNLTAIVPGDIATWCPAYVDQDLEGRKAFWTALLSSLSYHESTWRETVVSPNGLWFGLTQILPSTARAYGCEARSGSDLRNGEANLSCAVRIMNKTVARDGVVSAGMRGVAADWGPFHSRKKRTDMINWVSQQPYCQG